MSQAGFAGLRHDLKTSVFCCSISLLALTYYMMFSDTECHVSPYYKFTLYLPDVSHDF